MCPLHMYGTTQRQWLCIAAPPSWKNHVSRGWASLHSGATTGLFMSKGVSIAISESYIGVVSMGINISFDVLRENAAGKPGPLDSIQFE